MASFYSLYASISSGSRIFVPLLILFILYFAFLTGFFDISRLLNYFRTLRFNRYALFFISLSTSLIIFTTYRTNNLTAFRRLSGLLSSGLFSDQRLSTSMQFGLDVQQAYNLNDTLFTFLFGHGSGAGLLSWSVSSAYDGTIVYMSVEYGLLPSFILLAFCLYVLNYSSYRIRSFPSLILLICILFFSYTNEFISLKALPPIYISSMFIVSSLNLLHQKYSR